MPPGARDPNAIDEDPPPAVTRLSIQTAIRGKPGEPQLVSGRQTSSGRDNNQTWIVVTAKFQ
jgi:hypothetical protein